MIISKANTNKPWLSSEYDIPVFENEEMWSQRVIDEASYYIWLDIDKDEKQNGKKEQYNKE